MESRRYPIGAEVLREGGAHFRVWACKRKRVQVVLDNDSGRGVDLEPETDGYFSGVAPKAKVGSLYRFRLDDDSYLYPDPASRFQPEGPHGPSQIVDPRGFSWTDSSWKGIRREGQVIYEMHIGTFSPEGTWEGATRKLRHFADTGITVLEVMPVAEFSGRFGWGYDGVDLFAPSHLYGNPDDFRSFVDQAHALGIGVILDVVYNHFGPDGNYLKQFSEEYCTDRYENEWGEAINFDGPSAGPVREFFASNAAYWIDEYHLDGLRLDATQQIFDKSPTHILQEISRRTREAAGRRSVYLVAENEPQHTRLVRSKDKDGYELDALWNDDFHHSAVVALTGHNEAYYTDYLGAPQEFISAAKWGYLYQGQRYSWQKNKRGTPALDLEPSNFVTFIENHDQVANSGRGLRARMLSSPGRYRAMTALLLLGPGTPMLFQGQEFGSTKPFFYFADHNPDLGKLVRKGRVEFLCQFPSIKSIDSAKLADPGSDETFECSRLDWKEADRNTQIVALHRDLLKLRREDPVFRAPSARGVDGAVLGVEAFVLRFFGAEHGDRLLLVNFGRDLKLREAPEPLLAAPEGTRWSMLWSSESWQYGGTGHCEPENEESNWCIPGNAAVVLSPQRIG